MSELGDWLQAFLFGQAIEVPVYVWALRRAPRSCGASPWRLVGAAFAATALTHPVVWWGFPRLIAEPYWLMGALAESFAVLVEALYLYGIGVRGGPRALGVSALANGLSCGLGLLSRELFGWP